MKGLFIFIRTLIGTFIRCALVLSVLAGLAWFGLNHVLTSTKPLVVESQVSAAPDNPSQPSREGGIVLSSPSEETVVEPSRQPEVIAQETPSRDLQKEELQPAAVKVVPPKQEALSAQELEAKKAADDLRDRGKYEEAFKLYEGLERTAQKPLFAAYLRFQEGFCRLKVKRYADAHSIWNRLRTSYAQSPYASQSLFIEAEEPVNASQRERMLAELLMSFPKSNEVATVLEKRGQSFFDRKDYAKARDDWKRLAEEFPQNSATERITKNLEIVQLILGGDQKAGNELASESILKRADTLFDRASFEAAGTLYKEAAQKYPTPTQRAHATGRLAQCQQAQGRYLEAFQTLKGLAAQPSEAAAPALGEIVVRATNAKNMDGLRVKATEELLSRYPESFETQQALFIAGSVATAHKNRTEAQKWWNTLLEKYPESEFRIAVERELGLTKADEQAASDKPKELSPLAERQELAKAKAEQQKIWAKEAWSLESQYRDPQASPVERAQAAFEWGECCFNLEQYGKAVQQYQRVWEEFPQSHQAEVAAFRAAQSWFCTDQPKKGEEQSLFFINRYPNSTLRPFALFCLGNRQILYEGNLEKAWVYYDQLMKEYPQQEEAEQARKFWAKVHTLPKQKLKEQVASFVKQQKEKNRS